MNELLINVGLDSDPIDWSCAPTKNRQDAGEAVHVRNKTTSQTKTHQNPIVIINTIKTLSITNNIFTCMLFFGFTNVLRLIVGISTAYRNVMFCE